MRKPLAVWIAVVALLGIGALATGGGAGGHAVAVGTYGAAPGQHETTTTTLPPTTVPQVGSPPTTRPPAAPGENPTQGDIPVDTRPEDDRGNRVGPLPTGGTIGGTVIAPDGRPLAGICVDGGSGTMWAFHTTTGADGRWSAQAPDSFDTTVTGIAFTDCDGVAPHWVTTTVPEFLLIVSERATTVDVTLQPATTLDVRVIDPNGDPRPGMCVRTIGTSGGWLDATTDADGRASFAGVQPGPPMAQVSPTCAVDAALPILTPPTPLGERGLEITVPSPRNDNRSRAVPVTTWPDVGVAGYLATLEPGEVLPSCWTGGRDGVGSQWYLRPAGAAATATYEQFQHGPVAPAAAAAYREVGGRLGELDGACAVAGPDGAGTGFTAAIPAGTDVWVQVVTLALNNSSARGFWREA